MKQNNLSKTILTFCLLLIISISLSSFVFAAVDNWKYTAPAYGGGGYSSGPNYTWITNFILPVFAFIGLIWLTICVWIILTGKRENGKWLSPRRFVGLLCLIEPIMFALFTFLVYFIAMTFNLSFLILLVPLFVLAYFVACIWLALKNKVYSAVIIQLIAGVGVVLLILLVTLLGSTAVMSQGSTQYSSGAMPTSAKSLSNDMGFSVGGAKDIANFRANIQNNYFPQPSDLTYEGLFYDYYFDTGAKETCDKLFCPSYNYALTKDPFSKKDDYYLSVGLNSGMKQSDFQRKKLNLVVVLDMSGSMGSAFNSYYYDTFGKRVVDENISPEDRSKSKMQIANESVVELLTHLNPDDKFGMVLFDNQAYLAKPIELVKDTDMNKISEHILQVTPRGGTYFEAGLKEATNMFNEFKGANPDEYENRIVFLTDAMPNIGATGEDTLLGMTKKNANEGLHITFIGIGVDFQTALIEEITKIRGANYYSVHSAAEFKKRMGAEFDYMVTPLVFNLNLKLDSTGYEIEKVYGSPEANESTGELLKVNTLFPSSTTEEGTKGGIVLLKLKKLSPDATLKLKVSYENRAGNTTVSESVVTLPNKTSDYFENNGIRKGVLLARYADLLKNWMIDERGVTNEPKTVVITIVNDVNGIPVPMDINYTLNKWEHQSVPLSVSSEYKTLFSQFKTYFETEASAIGDNTLSQEATLLDSLIKSN